MEINNSLSNSSLEELFKKLLILKFKVVLQLYNAKYLIKNFKSKLKHNFYSLSNN